MNSLTNLELTERKLLTVFSQTVECDDEYEFESDAYYYGEIPEDITKQQLVEIMKEGILKLQTEYYEKENKYLNEEEVGEILDRWFEHDANDNDEFDHLVPEDEFEDFINLVVS